MPAPLRVIQVVNVRWFNATAWYGLFLSRLLKDAGHEVLVLGLRGTESFAKAEAMGLAPLGVDLNSANPLTMARTLRDLHSLVRKFKPHVVNCHRGEGMFLWGLLKSDGQRFALVRTRGDQRPPKANLPNKILHGRVADAVIATNSSTRNQCIQRLNLPPDHVSLVPGGVDTRIFQYSGGGRAAVREALGFAADEIVLGLLGRFDAVKGQHELIRAVARIRAGQTGRNGSLRQPDEPWRSKVRLMLAGFPTSSTSQETVKNWIAAHGLQDAAVITGKHPDVAGLISAMDIGVIASQGSEAIARAAFEIMSCRVPLVGTDVGVMPDLIPEYALVPPGDEDRLLALLERCISDADFRERLREEEGRRILDFSERNFLSQTLEVYARAMRRAGGGA